MKMFLSRFVVPGMAVVALSCTSTGVIAQTTPSNATPGTSDTISPGHRHRDENTSGSGEARPH